MVILKLVASLGMNNEGSTVLVFVVMVCATANLEDVSNWTNSLSGFMRWEYPYLA
jgi:hypothetical protein